MWDFYVAAAAAAGVAKADVGLQIEAEYGVPWTYLPVPATERKGPEVERQKAAYKERSLELKRQLLKRSKEARKVIPVDERGEPVWNEAKNGQFTVLVVKIDKEKGLEEFGRV